MKNTILLFLLFGLITRCATLQNPHQKKSISQEPKLTNTSSIGIIHVNAPNCPTFIKVIEAGVVLNLMPVNLPKKFEQEGFKIRFNYQLSNLKNSSFCEIDKIVLIFDVQLF